MAERPRSQPARLLVLGAGAAQLGLLEAAASRDLSVIAVDRNPLAPGFAFADDRAVISSEDEAGIERLAKAREVDGIISPGEVCELPAVGCGALQACAGCTACLP